MPRKPRNQQLAIQRARQYVARRRREIGCAYEMGDGTRCGATPVEFHSDRHLYAPHQRMSHRISAGQTNATLEAEMQNCLAYCRRHHMLADGRLAGLHRNKPRQPGSTVKPVVCPGCGEQKRLQRDGLCNACVVRRIREGGG